MHLSSLSKILLLAAILGSATLFISGCGHDGHQESAGHGVHYTCPMAEHADVISDKPGSCPKCGMKLVEKK